MFKEALQYIESRLSSNWSATPIDFDNMPFQAAVGTPFIRCQVEWAGTEQIGVGGRFRGEGVIIIGIFTPMHTGSRAGNKLADDVATIYNLYQYQGLKCRFASTMRIGQYREWYQINVNIPFQYDQCL